jgi:hypothetical protein
MPRSDPPLLPEFTDKKPIVRNVLTHSQVRDLQDYIKKQQAIIEADPSLTLDGIAAMATTSLGYTVKGTNAKSAMQVMGVRKGVAAKLSTQEAIRLLARVVLAIETGGAEQTITDDDINALSALAK